MNFEQFIPVLISLVITAMIMLIGFLTFRMIKQGSEGTKYDDLLQELLEDEEAIVTENVIHTKPTLSQKWNKHWNDVFRGSGLARYNDSENRAGNDMIAVSAAIVILGSVLTKTVIIGPILAGLVIFGSSFVLKTRANKKAEALNLQLPGFLFALKANIQASSTPERALLKVVDNMPSPLYDDLIVARNKILANASFKEALEELSRKTSSKDLQFLCACMIQASSSGANMEEQLVTIQRVIEARRKVADEIEKAVKTTQPAIWLSSFVIPGLFLASYFIDRSAQAFWFKDPFSWIALGVVIGLYLLGIFLVKKAVNKIRDL